MNKYFSQHEEEKTINKYLNKDPDKELGTYIDIGCGEPIEINNTYYYYLKGWTGLLIEPHPRYVERIKEIRPKDTLLSIAVHNYDREVEMCDTGTMGSYLGNNYRARPGKEKDVYTIKCMTMNTIIKEYPQFAEPDFCTIDITTNENKMLEKCNFTIFKPKLICIEDFGGYRKIKDVSFEWKHYLTPFYNLKETVLNNLFYIRKENK